MISEPVIAVFRDTASAHRSLPHAPIGQPRFARQTKPNVTRGPGMANGPKRGIDFNNGGFSIRPPG